MSINFHTTWLGGQTGLEPMGENVVTLYYTIIKGELPNDGIYTGPGSYWLNSTPKEGSLVVYVNGKVVPAVIQVTDQITGKCSIGVNEQTTGLISVDYRPLSDLIYFGNNESSVPNGVSMLSPLLNIHLTNIMYKLSQIEYVAGLPITLWNGIEITSPNYNEYNFLNEPAIIYSMKSRINDVVSKLNDAYLFGLYTLDNDNTIRRGITAEDIMDMRRLINAMQTKLQGIFP